MKKNLFFLFFLVLLSTAFAQQTREDTLLLIEGDSIPQYGITLKEVVVFQPLRFKTREELKRYILLRRRVFRVYPYAKLAADRLTVLNDRLNEIESKRGRKKYLKRLEKFIYEEFEEELKKLSKSQGRILIKLVHRQTGSTTFDLVKELRTGWNDAQDNHFRKQDKATQKRMRQNERRRKRMRQGRQVPWWRRVFGRQNRYR